MEDFINEKAKELFKINYVFPYQRLVISNTLKASGFYSKDDVDEVCKKQIVILPTGAGKSLCFMLPGIILPGVTLIIFPLLSLMADQNRRIKESGSTSVVLQGGMSKNEKEKATRDINNGEVKFILTNPETLMNPKVLDLLKNAKIVHVVIDETHIVSQWGESFRPSYLEVGKHIKTLGIDLITAYTATASDYIEKSVIKHIFLDERVNIIRGNPDRENISYSGIEYISREESLLELVKTVEKPLIIFHPSRVSTEVTNRFLVERTGKDDIVYYHAGLTKEQKKKIEDWFYRSNTGILNATCAYGLGVDKQGIRTVIHLEAPTSIAAFLQESGRGGRDRNPAKSIVLYSKFDPPSPIVDIYKRKQCRREGLLKLMGNSIEFCSGCDVCDGNIDENIIGMNQLMAFFSKNNGKYNIDESCKILKGYYDDDVYGLGLLKKWDMDSINDGIKKLLLNKIILKSKNPLYKGLLKINKGTCKIPIKN